MKRNFTNILEENCEATGEILDLYRVKSENSTTTYTSALRITAQGRLTQESAL